MKIQMAIVFFLTSSLAAYSQSLTLTEEEQAFVRSNPVIRLGASPAYAPMIIETPQGVSGFDRDYLSLITEETGLQFEIVTGEWNEVVAMALDGSIDGLCYSYPLEERAEVLDFTDPYTVFQAAYYGTLTQEVVNSSNGFQQKKIGVLSSDQFSTNYIKENIGQTPRTFDSRLAVVRALMEGSIDYYFGSTDMDYFMATHGIVGIKTVYLPVASIFPAVFSIRKDYPMLTQIMNKAIVQLSGETHDALRQRWNFGVQNTWMMERSKAKDLAFGAAFLLLGLIIWIITIFRQVDQKRNYRKQLQEEKSQLLAQIENSAGFIFMLDLDLRITNLNQNFKGFIQQIAGVRPRVGDLIIPLIPTEFAEKWENRYLEGLSGKKLSFEDTTSILGSEKTFVSYINPIKQDGKITGLSCITEDISEFTKMKSQMIQLLQTSHDFIFIKDSNRKYELASQSMADLLGLDHWRAMIGKTDEELDPENAPKYRSVEEKVLSEGYFSLNRKQQFTDRTGTPRWVQSTTEPLVDRKGEVIGLAGVSRDITKEKQIEDRLHVLASTIENSSDLIILYDHDYKVIYQNPSAQQVLGDIAERARTMEHLFPDHVTARVKKQLASLDENTFYSIENTFKCLAVPDSKSFDHHFYRVKDQEDNLLCFGSISRDMTAKNELQEQILQTKIQQQAMQSTLMAEEKERDRIAKDLHDGLQQKLALAIIQMQEDKPKNDSLALINESIEEIREISHTLSPLILKSSGLTFTLEMECKRVAKNTSIQTTFYSTLNDRRFEDTIEVCFYRIFQEALSNIMKYADSKHIDVQLSDREDKLTLIIEDDGVGFDEKQGNKAALGLESMRNRANLIGAFFEISSKPQHGTTVLLELAL